MPKQTLHPEGPEIGDAREDELDDDLLSKVVQTDEDRFTLVLIADHYPSLRHEIVTSSRLAVMVAGLREATGATPLDIVAAVANRELESAQKPIAVLSRRCADALTTIKPAPPRIPDPSWSDEVEPSVAPGVPVAACSVDHSRSVESEPSTNGSATRNGEQASKRASAHVRPEVSDRPSVTSDPSPSSPSSPVETGPTSPSTVATASASSETIAIDDTELDYLFPDKPAPIAATGLRRVLQTLTGGALQLRPSRRERARHELVRRISAPVNGCHNVAVVSLKGGTGKTTTTAMLGHTFASFRGDRVIALDASAEPGTLGFRVHREHAGSVRAMLDARASIERYADVRRFSSQAPSRLETVTSHYDPTDGQMLGDSDYLEALGVLRRFYSLIVVDGSPGVMHATVDAVIKSCDQLVVVTSPSEDSRRSNELMLDWLDRHGYAELVADAVVVVNALQRTSLPDDDLVRHFAQRCRVVERIPWDRHLAEGTVTDLSRLKPRTRQAYEVVAAHIAAGINA